MPFIAANVDQLQVGDKVAISTKVRNCSLSVQDGNLSGVVIELDGPRSVTVRDLNGRESSWVFDPSTTNWGIGWVRTWEVLNRNLPEFKKGQTVKVIDTVVFEGVVAEVRSGGIRFTDGRYRSLDVSSSKNVTRTFEVTKQAPLTAEEKLAAIKEALENTLGSGNKVAAVMAILEDR